MSLIILFHYKKGRKGRAVILPLHKYYCPYVLAAHTPAGWQESTEQVAPLLEHGFLTNVKPHVTFQDPLSRP